MQSKVCPKCKAEKPLNEFHKNKSRTSGIDSHCRNCVNEKNRLDTKNMTDEYIIKLMNSGDDYKFKGHPKDLIKTKRAHLKAIRIIRKLT